MANIRASRTIRSRGRLCPYPEAPWIYSSPARARNASRSVVSSKSIAVLLGALNQMWMA